MDDQLWWMIRWGGFSGVVDDEDDQGMIDRVRLLIKSDGRSGVTDDQLWWKVMKINWDNWSVGIIDQVGWMIKYDRQTINLLLSQWPMGRLYFTLIKMYSYSFNIHPLTVSDVLIFFAYSTIMGLVKMYKWGSCWQYSFMHYLIGLGFTLTQWPYPISYAYANAL